MSILVNKVFLLTHKDENIRSFLDKNGAFVVYPDSAEVFFDAAIFPPGDCVSPFLYGEPKLRKTTCNILRDMEENKLYRRIPQNVPKIGIGRGAHFLCVMNGGKLWQKVDGHSINHYVTCGIGGTTKLVTSKHTQEMIPPDHGLVFLTASVASQKHTPSKLVQVDLELDKKTNINRDIEGVFFEDTVSFCFQPEIKASPLHPAEVNSNEFFISALDHLVTEFFHKTVKLAA